MEMDRRVACAAAVMLFNSLRGARMVSRKRQRRLQRLAALLYEQEESQRLEQHLDEQQQQETQELQQLEEGSREEALMQQP
ncbi:hypothetical protein INR49_017605 [Caranx melampygus]|nr:hypothetical protein INR49_017605 [Caranx melampygus]